MTFESEAARTAYHELPTQEQLDLCRQEVELAREGKELVVSLSPEGSKVIFRIDEKFKLPVGTSDDSV